jgi:tetratricopeptide (TPR) repeat protein
LILHAFVAAMSMATPIQMSSTAQAIIEQADSVVAQRADDIFRNGDWNTVAQLLRMRAAQFPTDYEVVTDYGFILESLEVPEDALAVYRQFEIDAPNDPDKRLPEATFWYKRKQYAVVIRVLKSELARKPHHTAYHMLALAYEKIGQLDKAIETVETLLKVYPKDETAPQLLQRLKNKKAQVK